MLNLLKFNTYVERRPLCRSAFLHLGQNLRRRQLDEADLLLALAVVRGLVDVGRCQDVLLDDGPCLARVAVLAFQVQRVLFSLVQNVEEVILNEDFRILPGALDHPKVLAVLEAWIRTCSRSVLR